MHRFFVPFPLTIDVRITDTDILQQLIKVLRIQQGESIVLFDGDGSETEYEVTHVEKKSILLRGKNRTFPETETKKSLTLYQALPNKYEKIEYILQKGVEIGIVRFVFFRSERSQKLLISPAKEARFREIAREALEQCGGVIMPEIIFENKELVFPAGDNIVLDTCGESANLGQYMDMKNIVLWVGPEGGWSPQERQKMKDNGFIFARFGKRVLRTETAGVVIAFGLLHF